MEPVPLTGEVLTSPGPLRLSIQVEGTALAFVRPATGGDPLMEDLDLAKLLKFKRPADIRRLIDQHEKNLGVIIRAPRKIPGAVGRPSMVRLLNRDQALYIAAKSETDEAVRLLRVIIRGFVMAMEGGQPLPPPRHITPAPPQPAPPQRQKLLGDSRGRLQKNQQDAERAFLFSALRKHDGHNTQTAIWLGISRRALYDKMRAYGLDGEASAMRTEAGIMGPRKVEESI